MDSTMVEVTQADRDAAGPFANCLSDMQDIFDGKADGLPVVQAFARHRIQSEGRTGVASVADWRKEIGHPNNRLLFKRMAAAFGIDLGLDDVPTALRKVAALSQSTAGEDGA